MVCRVMYKRLQDENHAKDKLKLNNMLQEMETQVKTCLDEADAFDYQIELSVVKI